jgi:hypothetical protein
MQLVTSADPLKMYSPPPYAELLEVVAVLRVNIQLPTVGEEALLYIPPPLLVTEFTSNTQNLTLGEQE